MTNKQYRFLFVNLPYSGHINPTIPLVKRLVDVGHSVDYVLDPSFKEIVEGAGAQLIPYDDYDSSWSDVHRYMKAFEQAYSTAKRVSSESEYDCLIYEAYFIFGYKLSKDLALPTVRLFSTFAFNHSILEKIRESGGPHLSFMTSKNPLYSLFVKYYEGKQDMMITDDFFDEIAEGVQDLNIVYTARAFQPQSDSFSQDRFIFVGPSIEDNYSDDMPSVPFDELSRPVIYLAMGSLLPRFAKKVYQNCIDAFSGKEASLILSVGDELSKDDFRHVSDNIYLYSKVPQIDVLNQSDVFITHGGMNSANEGLSCGVPMLVHPFVNDEPLIASRLTDLKVAEQLNLRKSDPEVIYDKTMALLNDEQVKSASADMKDTMTSLGANDTALENIMRYLDSQ
ncbi:nucleotide disphospho-sugar-binding domain-containing protein [Alkalibacterium olivapovliticus]|uniref:MGT family glycosyltransferase n=1 Tax=Alkalibacterium olivapovliticus TaxID=99907 RepID=A0A2T0W7R6_9LACT|nr:nucleotide disphospho-sugar-binding domain-containing protein [Alkalibacterium olivapovliticus]PRY82719.1 MGT family glycosyltransferase [Alkalibacterium olivapovliticus]